MENNTWILGGWWSFAASSKSKEVRELKKVIKENKKEEKKLKNKSKN